MITRLYSLYDSVAEEFGPLFSAKNDEVALRNVIQMFTDMKVNIASVESYHLYYIGNFDTDNGHLVESTIDAIEIKIDYDVLANVFDAYQEYWDFMRKSKIEKSKMPDLDDEKKI